ncbi:50S ribosomal protein L23 [Candidatus Daviesbacteria bacterium]|nr:50S ribosomal protein L23 [Candidatus Daviesbacteria bacterium]
MRSILLRPLINEKSMLLIKDNLYTFEVNKGANKKEVKKLVAAKFSVDILSLQMINIPSKKKMQRSRKGYFFKSGLKKAIVRVKKGQKIPLFEVSDAKDAEEVNPPAGGAEGEELTTIKEKKSLLKGTKVKIQKAAKPKIEKKESKKKDTKKEGAK